MRLSASRHSISILLLHYLPDLGDTFTLPTYFFPVLMPKYITRPARDSRRWRRAAMNNPLCNKGDANLVLFFLLVAGALLLFLIGSILAYTIPNDPILNPYSENASNVLSQNLDSIKPC
jgi:hypothetical protein